MFLISLIGRRFRQRLGLAGRRCSCLVVVGWLALVRVAGAGADDVVARLDGAEIRRGDVEAVLQRLGLGELPEPEARQRAAATVLEQIIDERVLRAELRAAGIEVPAAEIDEAVARLREQVAGRGLEFDTFLAQTGRTPATIREQVGLEIGLERYVRPRITPAAVADLFDRSRREFDGTKLRVSHILLRPVGGIDEDPAAPLLEQAGRLRSEILQGRISFAEAARQHSAGPSRRRGGDIGWMIREGPMLDAFSSEVFKLSKGGLSGPFVTPFGVHLATVTDLEPGRIGIDEVRSRIEPMLAAQLVRELTVQGRARIPVEFAPGVPHLDPATIGAPSARRPVVVGEPAKGS